MKAAGHRYDRCGRVLDRHPRAVILVLVTWVVVVLVVLARGKPFWHDEVYTVLVSELPLADIWRASVDGIDLSAPMNAFLTHLVHAVTGIGPVTTRLPAILSFAGGIAIVFVVVRRRSTMVFAIAAAILATLTGAWTHAYEARGQGLSFGLYALALYGWLEAAAGRRVRRHLIVMALAIAAGLWTHYYFVLVYLPIVAGEAMRQILQRRIDRAPWLALVASGLLALPLLLTARTAAMQRETFWARPDRLEFGDLYHTVLGRLESANPRIATGALLLIALVALARRASPPRWPSRAVAYEVACGAMCLALPACGVLLGGVVGVFHERYVLFTAAGFAMVIPLVIWWLTTPSRMAEVVACLTMLHGFGNITEHAFRDPPSVPPRLEDHPAIVDALSRSGPVVLNGSVFYLPLWYYAPPEIRPRLLYLADPGGELRETGGDTVDVGYQALARWTTVPVVPLADFLRTHDRFDFYSTGPDWTTASLSKAGAMFSELRRDGHGTLYDVRVRPASVGR